MSNLSSRPTQIIIGIMIIIALSACQPNVATIEPNVATIEPTVANNPTSIPTPLAPSPSPSPRPSVAAEPTESKQRPTAQSTEAIRPTLTSLPNPTAVPKPTDIPKPPVVDNKPIVEADGEVRPNYVPSFASYLGNGFWATDRPIPQNLFQNQKVWNGISTVRDFKYSDSNPDCKVDMMCYSYSWSRSGISRVTQYKIIN